MLAGPAPLLEEECDIVLDTSVPDISDPIGFHRPRVRSALASNDYPVYALELQIVERADERLAREEPDSRRNGPQMLDSIIHAVVLDGCANPDVFGPGKPGSELAQPGRPFRQCLEPVPGRLDHGLECAEYEIVRDVLVEQIAHRVDEDEHRLLPFQGQPYPVVPQADVEALLEWVVRNATKTFREPLRVTVLAAGAHLGAAGDRVPAGVGPFDGG